MSNKIFSQINGFNEFEPSQAFIEAMMEVKEDLDKIRVMVIKAQNEVLNTNFPATFKLYYREIKQLLKKAGENVTKAQKVNTPKRKVTYH